MWMCSEKSRKGLFPVMGPPKAGRKRACLLPLYDFVSPHSGRQEIHTPYGGPGRPLQPLRRIQPEGFPGVLHSQGLYPTPPESPTEQADLFLPPSGWASLLTLLQGWGCAQAGRHLPRTTPPRPLCSHCPSLTSLPCPNTWSSWGCPEESTGGDGEQRL